MRRRRTLPIDAARIKSRIKELDLTLKKIEEESGGEIKETNLKHDMNVARRIDEETLEKLAEILDCGENELLDQSYLRSVNLSSNVNMIVNRLYDPNREKINSNYAMRIKTFRIEADLKTMLDHTHRLFQIISTEDLSLDKSPFVKAFDIIRTEFLKDDCISNMRFTGLYSSDTQQLYSKIANCDSTEYNPKQLNLFFVYVFILFEAIFLEEAIASACQIVPERKTVKVEPYLLLTFRNQRMRNALVNRVIYKEHDDSFQMIELGTEDDVIEAILLMLAACDKCYDHIHGFHVDSEVLNVTEFSAVLTMLEKKFCILSLELPEDSPLDLIDMNTSRFGLFYNALKEYFRSLNPPTPPRDKALESYKEGYQKGVQETMFFNIFDSNNNNDSIINKGGRKKK